MIVGAMIHGLYSNSMSAASGPTWQGSSCLRKRGGRRRRGPEDRPGLVKRARRILLVDAATIVDM